MKNQISRTKKQSLFLSITFFLSLFIQNTIAQTNCFTPAVNSDVSVIFCTTPPPNYVTHTGNDMKKATVSGNQYSIKLSVWDGDYPGFFGYSGAGSNCATYLPSGITDPDAVLYERSSSPYWYALVVYADANGKCVVDLYKGDAHTFTPVTGGIYPYTLQNSNNVDAKYSTAINIDLDQTGNFCIVWDDAESGNIMAQGGYFYNDEPVLCGNPTSKVVADSRYYHMPDVSLIKRSSTCSSNPPYQCYSNVFITYIDTDSPNILHVDVDNFEDWICGGGHVNFFQYPFSIPASSPLSSFFLYPRIACPLFDNNGFTSKEWTVVVEVYDPNNGHDDIVGYNGIGNTITPNIFYTDASTAFPNSCPINKNNNERNQFPVVSYDNSYDGMMVGWETEFSSSNLVPKGVVAVTCGTNAKEYTATCYDDFQIISSDNGANYHTSVLSISGRDYPGGGLLYTFNSDYPSIYYKKVAFPSCALRKRNISFENETSIFRYALF